MHWAWARGAEGRPAGGSGGLQSKESHVVSGRPPLEAAAAPPRRAADSQGPCPSAWLPHSPPHLALLVWPSFWVWPASRHWAHPNRPPKPGQNFLKPRCRIRFPEGGRERERTSGSLPGLGSEGSWDSHRQARRKGGSWLGGDRLGLLMTHSSCYKTFSGC